MIRLSFAIQSIDKGQLKKLSILLGFQSSAMRGHIILPQTFKELHITLVGEMIYL